MRPVCLHEGRLVECSGRLFYATKAGSQNVTGSFSTITGFTLVHAGGFALVGDTFEATYSGVYLVRCLFSHNTSQTGTRVRLLKNGSPVPFATTLWVTDADNSGVAVYETVVDAVADDALSLQAQRTSGPTRQITGGFVTILGPN